MEGSADAAKWEEEMGEAEKRVQRAEGVDNAAGGCEKELKSTRSGLVTDEARGEARREKRRERQREKQAAAVLIDARRPSLAAALVCL